MELVCDGCGNELKSFWIEAAVHYRFCMSCVDLGSIFPLQDEQLTLLG